MKSNVMFAIIILVFYSCNLYAEVSSAAPVDDPVSVTSTESDAMEKAIEPAIKEAIRTYPDAKKKFLLGLPKDQTFFVTTRITDNTGKFEQVFIAVDQIVEDHIHGKIWNDVNIVSGYAFQDPYQFPESELLDWLITHADGSEEGNFIGKFLDDKRIKEESKNPELKISSATMIGNELYNLIKSKKQLKWSKITNSKEVKLFLKQYGCSDYKYTIYQHLNVAYIVGKKKKDFLVGRHFKAKYENDSLLLDTISSSTKGCLNLGSPPPNVESLMTTHLQPYPNEFHVLQSKLAGLTLYVGTSTGIYAVEAGPIRLVQSKK